MSGLPASHLSDSTDSVTGLPSEFDVQSLPDPVYASTPQSSPTSLSFSDDSFVGNISPLSPEMSTFTSTSCEGSDDLTPQSTEKDMCSCLIAPGSPGKMMLWIILLIYSPHRPQ